MIVDLGQHQINALRKMHNGCILCGDVGSGKSRTALAYYFLHEGGNIVDKYVPLPKSARKLYIITTARKRDTRDWQDEALPFAMHPDSFVVDSWNNIQKYINITNAFFIFDEQRVVGTGAWVRAFLKIAKANLWILLSATPGDCFLDYAPVFIANGYFRNITEFKSNHVVYKRFSKFPQVERYLDTEYLTQIRNEILVLMPMKRKTIRHKIFLDCEYDKVKYKDIMKNRWNYTKNQPMQNAAELCYELRKLVNSNPSRILHCIDIWQEKKKVIIFYNFDYELELLKQAFIDICPVREWNGHTHEKVPVELDEWVYLVQYTAGAEGWNCTATDSLIFYSQNYSYKIMAQAHGRIDRMNTPFIDLYYYNLVSKSNIDMAIKRALAEKRNFNESAFVNK